MAGEVVSSQGPWRPARGDYGLPDPMPPAVAAGVRSMVTTAEVAALAGVPGEVFDGMLRVAREAFRAKTKEMVRDADDV